MVSLFERAGTKSMARRLWRGSASDATDDSRELGERRMGGGVHAAVSFEGKGCVLRCTRRVAQMELHHREREGGVRLTEGHLGCEMATG